MRHVALAAVALFAMTGTALADAPLRVDPITGMPVMTFDCAVEMQPGVLYERMDFGPIYPEYPGYPERKPAWMTGDQKMAGVVAPFPGQAAAGFGA